MRVQTDEACVHRSVKVIGERIEEVAVLQLIWLMNYTLHHLKYFLITGLEACVTLQEKENSVTYVSHIRPRGAEIRQCLWFVVF